MEEGKRWWWREEGEEEEEREERVEDGDEVNILFGN